MALTPIYASAEDLVAVLTEDQQARLTDDDLEADPQVNDEALIDTYLRYAESTAESYVGPRYGVPLSSPPDSFKYAILIIARHRLFKRRGIMLDDDMIAEYDDQIAWLQAIADAQADLYFADDEEEQPSVLQGYGDLTNTSFNDTDQPFNPVL